MTDRPEDTPRPLPRAWLPAATAPESAPEWQERAARIVAAAEPSLHRLGDLRPAVDASVAGLLGSWWRPAAALAAAAAALLLLLDPRNPPASSPGWSSLSVVAAAGEPVALWDALGIEADPVLALIALQKQADPGLEAREPR